MSSSRKSKSPVPGGPRPSYPRDSDRNHRAFLIRSLDRCDQDLAALLKLNRTLHTSRSNIVEQCGQQTLLDIGQGLLKLREDGRDELEGDAVESLPEEHHGVCVDFLLRMKLRRRLLNRLARRLNRVSRGVDGEDVTPPGAPKYGDLRLHVDPAAVRDFEHRVVAQEEVKRRIQEVKMEEEKVKEQEKMTEEKESTVEEKEKVPSEEDTGDKEKATEDADDAMDVEENGQDTGDKEKPMADANDAMDVEENGQEQKEKGTNGSKLETDAKPAAVPSVPAKATEQLLNGTANERPPPQQYHLQHDYEMLKEYNDNYEKRKNKSTGDMSFPILEREIAEDYVAISYGGGIGATHRSMSTKEKEFEFKRWQATLLAKIPDQPTFEELGLENRVFLLKERLEQLEKGDGKEDDEEEDKPTPRKGNKKRSQEEDGNDASPKKAKKESPRKSEREKQDIMGVDSEEKQKTDGVDSEEEQKTDGVDSEEEQKTDGENNVELVSEENEKVDSKEQTGDDTDEMETEDAETGSEVKTEDTDDHEAEEEEGESDDKDEDYTEDEGGKGDGDDEKEGEEDESEKDEEEDDEDGSKTTVEHDVEKKKRISLLAVPSFYEQDMRRIRLIHADLIASSIHEHARDQIAHATREYNAIFRHSNEIYNHRVKVQAQLNSLLYESRLQLSRMKNDYALEVALARSRWQKQKAAWDAQKMQSLMPAYSGRVAVGTPKTSAAASRPDPVSSQVGTTLSNVVDAVVLVTESGLKTGQFDQFVPPPSPSLTGIVDSKTGETLEQKQNRREASLRAELTTLSARLQLNEEERKRAWRKMLKTKAEFEMPNQQWANSTGRRGRGRVDPKQLQHLPVPPLRASAPAVAPPSIGYRSSIPAYVPPLGSSRPPVVARAPYGSVASDSKYSIAKVKERIAADGSVAPVSEPKKNKDGLYQRPAGRTRKGMEWDAVRGIWIPAANGGGTKDWD